MQHLGVKIFADGADKAGMLDLYANPLIHGLTTNPTLMKKAGITDYEAFRQEHSGDYQVQTDFVRSVFR